MPTKRAEWLIPLIVTMLMEAGAGVFFLGRTAQTVENQGRSIEASKTGMEQLNGRISKIEDQRSSEARDSGASSETLKNLSDELKDLKTEVHDLREFIIDRRGETR